MDGEAFLTTGEMGARIRAFDWARTSVGPIRSWPPHLRTTIGMMLRTRVPMILLWGADGVMIYNEGFAVVAGGKHPISLGAKVLEAWPEVADFNATVLEKVYRRGKALRYSDQHLVLNRHGVEEDAWFNLDYGPVVDETGDVSGVLAVVVEITERVQMERRLRMAQEAGGVGTFEWYPESRTLEASDEYRRIWGLPPGPITESVLVNLVHPDDRWLAGVRRVKSANPLDYAEFRIRRADTGETRWIARRGEVVGASGAGRRFVGVAIDITERKRAEDALRDSEARWRILFERMQEGFFLGEAIRNDDGRMVDFRFIEMNPAFELHSGLSPSATMGRRVREVVPDLQQEVVDIIARVVDTGMPTQFETFVSALNRWFEARVSRTDFDRFSVLFLDVTARRAAAEALAESEERFRTFAQSMPNHVWTASPDGALDWFNDQVYEYFGAAPGALNGDRWTAFLHPDDFPITAANWREALASGSPYQNEFRLRRRDGEYRWHIARALPIYNEAGEIRLWIGTNTDIQDQKSASEQLTDLAATLEERVAERTDELTVAHEALRQSQKMEAVGQLTGGIAHDFNNLLQGIVGSLDLVRKRIGQGRTNDVDRFVSAAISSANRAAALTHRLLAFSRRQPLDPKPLKTNPLVGSMEDLLRRTIGEQIRLELNLADELWSTICDHNQLESAILNLVLNARDAMPNGGTVTIRTTNAHVGGAAKMREVQPGDYVCIAVSDSGIGMSKDVVDRAFEPFFTTKALGHGTGLGLSMVYGFARQSEGYARIASEVGGGTTVKLYLPRFDGDVEVERPADESAAINDAKAGEVVLVIEDDTVVRALVLDVLQELGYGALEAPDGTKGLAILESRQRIDLLITDIGLPGLNGRQVADAARAMRPDLKVLFMTGYAETAARAGGFLEPGMAMVTKPFPMETLAARIRTMIGA